MPEYPPIDPSAARVEAANALLMSLREVRDVLDRLQLAAAWVLDVYGDTADAETVRMLRIPGGPERPGKPAVPPPAVSRHSTDDLAPGHFDGDGCTFPSIGHLVDVARDLQDDLDSVTGDESGSDQ